MLLAVDHPAFRLSLLPLLVNSAFCQTARITVTSPAADEAWAVGSSHVISWESEAWHPSVNISFSIDGGATWIKIADQVPDWEECVGGQWEVADGKIPNRSFSALLPLSHSPTLRGVDGAGVSRTVSALHRGDFVWKVPFIAPRECKVRVESEVTRSFAIISSQAVPNYRWVNVTMKAPFAPRDGAGAIVYDGRMWLLGGWNPQDKQHFPRICNNEVWNSQDGATWTLVKPNTFTDRTFDPNKDWEGRHTAGYVVFRGKMWVVGGDMNQGHYQNDVWNSADGKTWTRVNPGRDVPWGPRALHHTVIFHDRTWVIGGQTCPAFVPGKEIFYRDIWNSPDGLHWEKLHPVEPYWSARGMIGGHAVFHDRIWILGGGTYDTPSTPWRTTYNDIWSSRDGIHWDQVVATAPWKPREYHDVAVFDDRLWVLGGYDLLTGNRKDVWYSVDGANWYELPDTPWKPRHASSIFAYRDALWVVVGNNMQSDVWRLGSTAPEGHSTEQVK